MNGALLRRLRRNSAPPFSPRIARHLPPVRSLRYVGVNSKKKPAAFHSTTGFFQLTIDN